jgi:hypothetical protein
MRRAISTRRAPLRRYARNTAVAFSCLPRCHLRGTARCA